jgi:hypothetical protein
VQEKNAAKGERVLASIESWNVESVKEKVVNEKIIK